MKDTEKSIIKAEETHLIKAHGDRNHLQSRRGPQGPKVRLLLENWDFRVFERSSSLILGSLFSTNTGKFAGQFGVNTSWSWSWMEPLWNLSVSRQPYWRRKSLPGLCFKLPGFCQVRTGKEEGGNSLSQLSNCGPSPLAACLSEIC